MTSLAANRSVPSPDMTECSRTPPVAHVRLDAVTEDLIRDWRDLARAAIETNVFQEPDFLLPQLAAFAPEAEILTVRTAEPGGELLAAVPIAPVRLGFGIFGRVPGIWGNDYAPLGVPLVHARNPVATWVAILSACSRSHSVIAIPAMRLDGPCFAALDAALATLGFVTYTADTHTRAAIAGPETFPAGAADFMARHRGHARRWRRLSEQGNLHVERIVEPAAVEAAFEEYLSIEAAGWKGRSGTAMAQDPAALRFGRSAAGALARNGQVVIHRVVLDERPISILVMLVSNGVSWPWKISFDEAFAQWSPGVQTIRHATEAMLRSGSFARADSLAPPGSPLMEPLWPDRIAIGTIMIALDGVGRRARLAIHEVEARAWLKRHYLEARDRLRKLSKTS